jgi:hypothetical protein
LSKSTDIKSPLPYATKGSGFFYCRGEIKKMTLYELYQQQKDFCELMGQQENINTNLRAFFAHAARGYEIKLENLKLNEATL